MRPIASCPRTERRSVRERGSVRGRLLRLVGVIFSAVVLAVAVPPISTGSAAAASPQIFFPQDEGPHGNGGALPYGPLGESFHYSRTNLKVSGVVMDYGVPVQVIGSAWFDHQWGDFLPNVAGWDWFSVQLTNATQYMVYLIKDGDGQIVQKVGTLVKADGSTPS